MAKYTEDDVAEAIFDFTDRGISLRKAAAQRGIPRSTLQDRMKGAEAKKDQFQPFQRLSKTQEDRICQWILRQEALGFAISHRQLRHVVDSLLSRQGEVEPIGRKWIDRFISRRPELKTKIGKVQEAVRFDAFTPKAVNWYFDIREQFDWIKPENTVNVDEGGIMAGFG